MVLGKLTAARSRVDPFGGTIVGRQRFRVQRKPQAVVCCVVLLLLSVALGAAWLRAAAAEGTGQWGSVGSPAPPRADIVFVMDATGSMGDEIHDVKTSLMGIGNRLANRKPQPDVRFGAVFYRDIGDRELVRSVQLSHDLDSVRDAIMDVGASGGGDWREHAGIGLHKALEMNWSHSDDGGVRLMYLVADAPYHTYDDGYDVPSALELAKQMGVKVHVIGCSGLGDGEADMANIAHTTGGTFSSFERTSGGQHSPDRGSPPVGASIPHLKRGLEPGVMSFAAAPRLGAPFSVGTFRRFGAAPASLATPEEGKRLGWPVVGMHLGATTSSVGIYRHGRSEIIPNEYGELVTPSCVYFSDAGPVVGREARQRGANETSRAVFGMKRLIGRNFSDASLHDDVATLPLKVVEESGMPLIDVVREGGNRTSITPEEALAAVAAKMKDVAESYLGQEVGHAIIAVPAHFNDAQRRAVVSAGEAAGLHVLRVINEPTAAAIAYGLDKRSEWTVLVYDLGGSSLEVSLLTIDTGVFELVATSSDPHLGGEDFDKRTLQHITQKVQVQTGLDISGREQAMRRLGEDVVRAKHELSSTDRANVKVDAFNNGTVTLVSLTRLGFAELNEDLFGRSLAPVRRVLEDAGVQASAVDEVVLAGGSSRIPAIHQLLADFFGETATLTRGIAPDQVVAHGAAMQGHFLSGEGGSDLLLLDVTPLTIGVETCGGRMTRVVGRNTVIPTKRSLIVATTEDNQATVPVRIFEGERPMTADAHFVAEFELLGLPTAPAGAVQVEITVEVDGSGSLFVSAEEKGTGASANITVASDESRLKEGEIERLIKDAEIHAEKDRRAMHSLGKCTGGAIGAASVSVPEGGGVLGVGLSAAELSYEEDDEASSGGPRDDGSDLHHEPRMGRLSEVLFRSMSDEL